MPDDTHKKDRPDGLLKSILVAVIVGVIVSFANYLFTQKEYFQQSIWTQKRDAYIRALKVVNRMIRSSPNNGGYKIDLSISPTAEEVNDSYVEIATFSNSDVVKAYVNCLSGQPQHTNLTRNVLINAMRKDLGVGNLNLADDYLLFDYGLDQTKINEASKAGFH